MHSQKTFKESGSLRHDNATYLKIDKIFETFTKIMVYIGAAILIFVMCVAFVDVIIAKIFGSSIPYATEIITYCDVPLAYLGMAYTLLIGQMTAVDILFGKLKERTKMIANGIYDVLGVIFCGILGKLSFSNMVSYMQSNTLSNPKGGFVIWPFAAIETISWFALAAAFAFCLLRFVFAPSLIATGEPILDEAEHIGDGKEEKK
jgi:TRAP-type C4-dicarboxylate transport system permease small subunit